MTLQEILNAQEGHSENEYNEWRRTRQLGTWVYNAFGGKVKPTDLMELPGDNDSPTLDIDKIKEDIKAAREWRTER